MGERGDGKRNVNRNASVGREGAPQSGKTDDFLFQSGESRKLNLGIPTLIRRQLATFSPLSILIFPYF